MPFDTIMHTIVMLAGAEMGCLLLVALVGSTVYDIREARRERARRQHPRSGIYRRRVPFSVVLYENDKPEETLQTIRSLKGSKYHPPQVIIFSTATQAKPIRKLLAKEKLPYPVRYSHTFTGLKRQFKKDHILTLTAGSKLERGCLDEIQKALQAYERPDVLLLNHRLSSQPRMQNLLERLYEAPKRFGRKAVASTGRLRTRNSMYMCWSHQAFMAKHGNSHKKKFRTVYVSSAKLTGKNLRTKHTTSLYDLLYVLPFLAYTVLLYLAIALKTPLLFITSWALVTVGMVIIIWLDDFLSVRDKLKLTVFTPLVFNLWIITSH